MFQKITHTFVIYLICCSSLLLPLRVQGIPVESGGTTTAASNSSDEYNGNLDEKTKNQLRQCDINLETMELCMRCAKVTKSTIVYPLCCANEDRIKDWCISYVYYGKSE